MFHYFGTLTNTRGDSLVGWQVECVQLDDGSTVVPIYADENETAISSVSGIANRAVTDEQGNYDFFVVEGDYSLRFYNSAGVFQRTHRYLPMYGRSSGAVELRADLADPAEGKGASLVVLEDGTDLETAVTASAKTADLASTASGKGAALIGRTTGGTLAQLLGGIANVDEYGAAGDGTTDDAAAIQAALDDSANAIVELSAKTYAIGTKLTIPTGKTLRGRGRGKTTLKYLPGLSLGSVTNAMIDMAASAENVRVGGFAVDGAYVGFSGLALNDAGQLNARVHCIIARGKGFRVEDVSVKNCWGYAFWANGGTAGTPCSGEFRGCYTDNANVQFETNFCDGVLWENCHGISGDTGASGYANLGNESFHPLVGSKNVTWRKCSFVGVSGAPISVNNNGSTDMTGIVFDDCRVTQTDVSNPAISTVSAGTGRVEIKFIGGEYYAPQDAPSCANFDMGTASALEVDINGSRFDGGTVSVLSANGAVVIGSGARAHGRTDTSGSTAAFGVSTNGVATLIWDGAVSATGPAGSSGKGGLAQITSRTLQSPPPSVGATVFQEFKGLISTNINRDGFTDDAYVIFALPSPTVDWSKVACFGSIMRSTHGAPFYTGPERLTFSPFSASEVMMQIKNGHADGLTAGGYHAALHYIELA